MTQLSSSTSSTTEYAVSSEIVVRSPLKYAGSKRQLLSQIVPILLPHAVNRARYFEPFVGGGSVFFAVSHYFERSYLNDGNAHLINFYRVLRDNLTGLISQLSLYVENRASVDAYYAMRSRFNALRGSPDSQDNRIERAALLYYLNKTGFNGLYRVNSKGDFNVPCASYKDPKVCNVDLLALASQTLRNIDPIGPAQFARPAHLKQGDFVQACDEVRQGDVVYFDPPYMPASQTSNFTAYTKDKFGLADHERLFALARSLVSRGAFVLISEGDTPKIRELAQIEPIMPKTKKAKSTWTTLLIQAKRAINSNGDKRGHVPELLIYGGGD